MAVVDELITRIGFEVIGVDELKKAQKAKEDVEKSFLKKNKEGGWADTSRDAARARAKFWSQEAKQQKNTAKGQGAVTDALEKTGGAISKNAVLFRLLAGASVLAIGGLIYGLTKLATMLVSVGVAAAKARRELQVSAKAMGTTIGAMDVLTNFFSIFSIGRDAAREWANASVKAISEVVDAAKKGDAEAKKKLMNLGPGVAYDEKGKIRDSSEIVYGATQRAKKLYEQSDVLRNKGQTKKADEIDQRASRILTAVGLSKVAQQEIKDSKLKASEFYGATQKQNEQNPTWSTAQEERAERVAKKWNEVSDKFGAISDAIIMKFQQLGIGLANGILPIIDKILDAIIRFGKATGLLPKTEKEVQDELKENKKKTGDIYSSNPEVAGKIEQGPDGKLIDNRRRSGAVLWEILYDQMFNGGAKTSAAPGNVDPWANTMNGYHASETGPGVTTATPNIINNNQVTNPTAVVNQYLSGYEGAGAAASQGAQSGMAASLSKQNNTSTAPKNTP